MRNSCVKPVEIGKVGGGNEQIFCTALTHIYPPLCAKLVSSTHQDPHQSSLFPQAKVVDFNLLSGLFSPQSTRPINTITIHIN